ncbi:MAG: UbiA family prenyltransferase [Candidatus Kapabacteria bacterium]|nr:UbiA family prenyltransferase [Candidatus Kapabacteria bacterium]
MFEDKVRKDIPLCVDLDGTLLKTDLLYESVIYLLKKNFFYIFLLPVWILKGRYFLKFKLLEYVSPTISSMPFNDDVIEFVKSEREKGRKIVLVTASAQPLADKAADFTGLFDEVLASKDGTNLLGSEKAKLLKEKYGYKKFDYIGDSPKDLQVWENSDIAHIVSTDKSLIAAVNKTTKTGRIFQHKVNKLKVIIKQIRVHQWIKNLLIFLPPLLAHKIIIGDYISAIWAFFAFSFIASGIYVINDLADIESDRNHSGKKNRPAASGQISILACIKLIPLLLIAGFVISLLTLDMEFTLILLAYMIITIMYSFKLKKIYLLDMITLSMLYSIRLISGGIASDTILSPWLFSFSLFIFLSMGAMKRYTELLVLSVDNKTKTRGRDYYVEDIPLITTIGISAGIVSTLIFTLYIDNPDVMVLYNTPFYLYFITPVVLYWILRMWFITHRGLMNDDPIVFALKDKVSYIVAVIIFVIAYGATL